MRIAFYDKSDSGHHLEFIKYLIQNRSSFLEAEVVMFITTKAIEFAKELDSENISFLPCFSNENKGAEYDYIYDRCIDHKIDHLFFLNIDPYLTDIGKKKYLKANFNISGIYFHPYHRIKVFNLKSGLQKLKRKYRLTYSLRNKNVKNLFLLDDKFEDQNLNKKFAYLPDPIELPSLTTINNDHNRNANNKIFILAFGSIIKRKNLHSLIKAVSELNSDIYELHIVGKGNEQFVKTLKEYVDSFDTKAIIKIENRFVSTEEKDFYFKKSDIISMVYKDFYGSSGALGHAVAYGKKVIVADKGLIHYLVQKYNLGITVDTSTLQLKNAILNLANAQNENEQGGVNYLKSKTPKNFASTIYSNLLN